MEQPAQRQLMALDDGLQPTAVRRESAFGKNLENLGIAEER
jgi:hypothetical protein